MGIHHGNVTCLHFIQEVNHKYSLLQLIQKIQTFRLFCFFFKFSNNLDSRKYPTSMPVTVQNVLGFILANLNRLNRMEAIVSIAKYRHRQKQSIDTTIVILRRETESNIIESLRAWRLNPRKRNYILRLIQALRRLYFTLHNHSYNHSLEKIDELIKEVSYFWIHDTMLQ